VSFKEIASIIDRSEAAAKQLASRARRQVQGGRQASVANNLHESEIVTAFLAASREGDYAGLLRLLAPDVALRADATAVKVAAQNRAKGAPHFETEIRGAGKVAETLKGRAVGAQRALINGHMGATWAPGGKPVVAFMFTVESGRIVAIDVVMDPEHLKKLDVEILHPNSDGPADRVG
jgi:ketosteroid isomerase-like protein